MQGKGSVSKRSRHKSSTIHTDSIPTFEDNSRQHYNMSARLSSTPISVIPSDRELQDGTLGQRNLEIAVRAIARDGLVVLENMVDEATLDSLNEKMVEDAYKLQASKNSPYNYNKGNIQQDPPMAKKFFSEKIYTSKFSLSLQMCCCSWLFGIHKLTLQIPSLLKSLRLCLDLTHHCDSYQATLHSLQQRTLRQHLSQRIMMQTSITRQFHSLWW